MHFAPPKLSTPGYGRESKRKKNKRDTSPAKEGLGSVVSVETTPKPIQSSDRPAKSRARRELV